MPAPVAAGHGYAGMPPRPPERPPPGSLASARAARALPAPDSDSEASQAPKANIVERAREKHKRAYEKWSAGEDAQLKRFLSEGMSERQIAQELQRQRSAIRSRIVKFALDAERADSTVEP